MLQYLHGFVYKPPVVLGIIGPMKSDLCVEMNEVASSYAINQVGLVLCCTNCNKNTIQSENRIFLENLSEYNQYDFFQII